jgi:hypothetical protein
VVLQRKHLCDEDDDPRDAVYVALVHVKPWPFDLSAEAKEAIVKAKAEFFESDGSPQYLGQKADDYSMVLIAFAGHPQGKLYFGWQTGIDA